MGLSFKNTSPTLNVVTNDFKKVDFNEINSDKILAIQKILLTKIAKRMVESLLQF